MMTALTAIFGLLPAALSTKIGSQTQQPLAIVVVGGMITHAVSDPLPDARALQLLRPPRTVRGVSTHGALSEVSAKPPASRQPQLAGVSRLAGRVLSSQPNNFTDVW